MVKVEIFDGVNWYEVDFDELKTGDVIRIFVDGGIPHTIRGETILYVKNASEYVPSEYSDLPEGYEVGRISIIPFKEKEFSK